MKIDVRKRSIGVNINWDGLTEVLLWAPEKKAEIIINDEVVLPLKNNAADYWQLTTDIIKAGDRYKFILNNETQFPDPASLSQPEGVHGHSEVIKLNDFKWTDAEWNNVPLENYFIYELHTGTFTTQGTFAGIEEKLDYLIGLGINAIEIMPVAQFPGTRNWGYDGVSPFAVQNSYGGAKGLQHLVNACHEKGLAVILDVVYNHMGPEGNYFREFGPYFTDKHHTPWGDAINFDDTGCEAVRQYFIENTLMWFRDFHIDALRMDAVHAIKDSSHKHILKEIKQYVNQLMEETGRIHYLIIECDLNDSRYINPIDAQGYGIDAQWSDEFHHSLRVTAGGERNGYYADFNGIEHLAKAYKDAYVYTGEYSTHRKKNFGTTTENNPGKQFVVFSQNHDQIGNRLFGERTSQLVSFEMQKLMAGAVIVSPFLPLLFMGEEWAEPHPFLYFVSHGDPELVAAVRKGRKAEFAAFHSENEASDPQSEETFEQSKLQWDLIKQEPYCIMLQYYKALIALRKEQPALYHLNRKQLEVTAIEEQQVLLLHRWHENNYVLCLMNFSKVQQPITLPDYVQHGGKIFDSADPKWKGPVSAPELITNTQRFTLQPESLVIYTYKHV